MNYEYVSSVLSTAILCHTIKGFCRRSRLEMSYQPIGSAVQQFGDGGRWVGNGKASELLGEPWLQSSNQNILKIKQYQFLTNSPTAIFRVVRKYAPSETIGQRHVIRKSLSLSTHYKINSRA